MSAEGGTGSSFDLISSDDFRHAFEHFLLNFNLAGSEFLYRDQIRSLSLSPFLTCDDQDLQQDLEVLNDSSTMATLVKIEIEHFRMPHWLPGNCQMQDGMETLDFDRAEDSSLRRACEGLYNALKTLPTLYIPIMEFVVRDIYVLLDMLSRPGLHENLATMEDVGRHGCERVLQTIPGAADFRNRLMPFQVELISRECPMAIRSLKASKVERLVNISGIVIQVSKLFVKAVILHIRCKDCGNSKTLKIPMWKEGVSLPRSCEGSSESKCGLDPFVIINEDCKFVDVQNIKLQELPDEVPTGDIPRHLSLNLTNGLVNRVTAGARIVACGIYSVYDRKRGGHGNTETVKAAYLHVLGIDCRTTQVLNVSLNNHTMDQFHFLAGKPDIIELIAKSIAPSIYGLHDIKKSVSCMLFGGSRKSLSDGSSLRGDIHLLLLGDPSTAKSQLLKFVEKAAPIAVYTSGKGSSAAGLTAALVRDMNGNYALEGGAMVLADGGVVCIDEFDKMRDDDRVAIHEAMEQQTISIAKAGINTVLTTQCAVIAAANPTFGCYDDTKDASDQHNFETTILSRFDCIWLVRDERDLVRDKLLAQHIFSLYTSGNKQSSMVALAPGMDQGGIIPLPLLKAYITHCRTHCHPRLSPEGAKRLENFYVEVREKSRTDSKGKRDQIPITVRQLESLVRLAEAFARMSLSPLASTAHVEEAIRIFKISTVATSQSTVSNQNITQEDRVVVKNVEQAVLQRLPIGGRVSKTTIVRDLRLRGFESNNIAKALGVLIQKGTIEERGDATVRRVQA